jgi:putative phage-type endonuclease
MNLPILSIKQNTPEWHQWRAHGIGASEIAALYGKHPYMTEYQLWLQKIGQAESFQGNVATEHGQRLESQAFLEIQYEHKDV